MFNSFKKFLHMAQESKTEIESAIFDNGDEWDAIEMELADETLRNDYSTTYGASARMRKANEDFMMNEEW